eukprot:c46833_g1_i1 orf=3-176(-)
MVLIVRFPHPWHNVKLSTKPFLDCIIVMPWATAPIHLYSNVTSPHTTLTLHSLVNYKS